MIKDLSDYLSGEGWDRDVFGILIPPGTWSDYIETDPFDRYQLQIRDGGPIKYLGSWGISILADGSVTVHENGQSAKVKGWDAIGYRKLFRSIIGEELADEAGIEPE